MHPRVDELQAFLSGQLSAQRQSEIEAHVLSCEQCGQSMEKLPEDTLLAGLRSGATLCQNGNLATQADGRLGGLISVSVPEELSNHPRYRIVKVLGRGGMGVVFLAEHMLMERPVALKVIDQGLVKNPQMLERFRIETKAAARLDHRNIVRAFDAEQAGDVHFLVMEYVDGVSLDRLVADQGALSAGLACHLISQAAQGLQHAAKQGMVHRDIKPHNLILARDGTLKILDFGLALLGHPPGTLVQAGQSKRVTRFGAVLGTPDYMAPEQTQDSRSADIRADIYSLGCTLYFLLAGRPPFPHGDAQERMSAHAELKPAALTEFRKDLPADLHKVIDRMMSKQPAQRYATPGEVVQALAPFATAPPTASIAVEASPARKRGHLLPIIAGIGLCVLLALVGWWALNGSEGDDDKKSTPAVVAKKQTGTVLVVIPHENFYYPDIPPIQSVLEGAGINVKFASSNLTPAKSHDGAHTIVPDLLLKNARADAFDAAIFTGAPADTEFTTDTPQAEQARRLINDLLGQGKYVGSICRGVEVVASTGLLKDKKIAQSIWLPEGFAQKIGAKTEDAPFVRSGNLVTGRNPEDAETFATEMLRLLREPRAQQSK